MFQAEGTVYTKAWWREKRYFFAFSHSLRASPANSLGRQSFATFSLQEPNKPLLAEPQFLHLEERTNVSPCDWSVSKIHVDHVGRMLSMQHTHTGWLGSLERWLGRHLSFSQSICKMESSVSPSHQCWISCSRDCCVWHGPGSPVSGICPAWSAGCKLHSGNELTNG